MEILIQNFTLTENIEKRIYLRLIKQKFAISVSSNAIVLTYRASFKTFEFQSKNDVLVHVMKYIDAWQMS